MRLPLLLACILSASPAIRAQPAGLSPRTRIFLHTAGSAERITPQRGYAYTRTPDGTLCLSALIHVAEGFSGEALQPLGIRIGTKAGRVWTALIPLQSLRPLTQTAGIRYIELDEPVYLETTLVMDSARRATRTDSVHAGTGLPAGLSGAGTVVGIIDAGFDYGHPSLYDTTGLSGYRVRRVWEQKTAGTPPAGYTYGRELSTEASLLLAGTDGRGSHGTHVAGIAGGSGWGGSTDGRQYRGGAYSADLVLVGIQPPPSDWTSTGMSSIVDGMKYVYDYAASVGKPAVANLSWGCTVGPHDGASLFSQAVDALTGPGKIFCLSAGNNGTANVHLAKTFTPADTAVHTALSLPLVRGEPRTWVDVWGDTAQTFSARIRLFAGSAASDSTALIPLDGMVYTFSLLSSTGDTCFVTATGEASAFNGKPRLFLDFYNKSASTPILSLTGISGSVDAWMGYVDSTRGYYGAFLAYGSGTGTVTGNTALTVGDMACTERAVTVGAFMSKKNFVNISGTPLSYPGTLGAIASFSSRGPTADDRTKPDITGPGHTVVSAASSYDEEFLSTGANYDLATSQYPHPTTGRTYPYAALSGTSMSSPAVSGIVALMLGVAPALSPERVRGILRETAIEDARTGDVPTGGSNTWGWGKVNASAAVQGALQAAGIETMQGAAGVDVLLFPNPGSGRYTLAYTSATTGEATLHLRDAAGRAVYSHRWTSVAGANEQRFDWEAFPSGTYLLQILVGGAETVIKVQKK